MCQCPPLPTCAAQTAARSCFASTTCATCERAPWVSTGRAKARFNSSSRSATPQRFKRVRSGLLRASAPNLLQLLIQPDNERRILRGLFFEPLIERAADVLIAPHLSSSPPPLIRALNPLTTNAALSLHHEHLLPAHFIPTTARLLLRHYLPTAPTSAPRFTLPPILAPLFASPPALAFSLLPFTPPTHPSNANSQPLHRHSPH